MKAPYLNPIQTNKPMLNSFAGINRGERIDYTVNQTTVGEWAEAENLTTEQYPVAMTREKRCKREYFESYGMLGGRRSTLFVGQPYDAVCVDKTLYLTSGVEDSEYDYYQYFLEKFEDDNQTDVHTSGPAKQIVSFGGGVFTIDGTFIPYTDGELTAQNVLINLTGAYVVEPADAEGRSVSERWLYKGEGFDPSIASSYEKDDSWASFAGTRPANPADGAIWFDTANGEEYRYNAETGTWDYLGDSYLLIAGADLHKGDFVYMNAYYIRGYYTVVDAFEQIGTENPSASPLVQKTWKCAVIKAKADPMELENHANVQGVIQRRRPVFDYICSSRNRVWGCRYGLNDMGEFVNEIYASELGNATNFFRIQDKVSDESWIASVGTGGEWTGCVPVEDNIFFFKEDRIFFVTGTEPANFSFREIEAPGIAPGQYRSAIVKNGEVYYAAKRGVYKVSAYGYPVCISDKLRFPIEAPALGIADKDKLRWITEHKVYVYDINLGAWMIEEPLAGVPVSALRFDGYPLVICGEPNELIPELYDTTAYTFGDVDIDLPNEGTIRYWQSVEEDPVEWFAETGLKGLGDPEPKRVKNIKIRLKTEEDTDFRVFIKLDEDETWIPIADEKRAKAGTYLVRYVPDRRCDLYRLRFEGKGHTVIYSITEEYENAGDVSVGL